MNKFIQESWNGSFEKNYRGLNVVNNATYKNDDARATAQKDYLITSVAEMNPK